MTKLNEKSEIIELPEPDFTVEDNDIDWPEPDLSWLDGEIEVEDEDWPEPDLSNIK